MSTKIRTLIVDDSRAMRLLLTEILNGDPDIEVVGAAGDPLEAREMIKALNPDVLTLDIEMPRMDGLTFLEKLMRMRPMPVIMVSSLTQRSSEATLQALSLGAVDFVGKPMLDTLSGMEAASEELRSKVRMASKAKLRIQNRAEVGAPALAPSFRVSSPLRIIAIGASTGGTEAIRSVLPHLPTSSPPVVIVQHIPPGFSDSFATRLNDVCSITVKIGEDGEILKPGHAYVAPGGRHMEVRAHGSRLAIAISDDPPVNLHRPSVDVLFDSVATHVGKNAIGVILTGMGADGALGMKMMHAAGAQTIAQDEATCVVFGMPAQAIAKGAVDTVLPLPEIPGAVLKLLSR